MADPIDLADEKRAEANRLYWEDPRPVDEVAAALAMSRSALYAAVVPLPAGVACIVCGGDTAYPNRKHRSLGTVRCTTCGEEATEGGGDLGDDVFDAVLSGTPRSVPRPENRGVGGWQRDVAAVDDERKRLIGGGAALGLLAGLVAGVILRR